MRLTALRGDNRMLHLDISPANIGEELIRIAEVKSDLIEQKKLH